MSGLVKFFYPWVVSSPSSGRNNNTQTVAAARMGAMSNTTTENDVSASLDTSSNPAKMIPNHDCLPTHQRDGDKFDTSTNENQQQQEIEYKLSLGNMHEYTATTSKTVTTNASAAINTIAMSTPTRSRSNPMDPSITRYQENTTSELFYTPTSTTTPTGVNGKEMKHKSNQWKQYCYSDLKQYLAVRLFGLPEDDEEDENSEINDNDEEAELNKIKEVHKMIGEYYYDSEIENDSNDGSNDNDAHDDDNSQNEEEGVDENMESPLEESQIMTNPHYQLETQPLLSSNESPMISSSSSLLQENHQHAIREFTPPITTTTATTTSSNGVAIAAKKLKSPSKSPLRPTALLPSISNSLSKQEGVGTTATKTGAIQTLYQTQDTNSSFYSPHNKHHGDDDASFFTANQKESTTTALQKKSYSSSTKNARRRKRIQNYVHNGILPIPHISKATKHTTKIHDINLKTTKTLSIPIASIKLLWGKQNINQVHCMTEYKSKMIHCCESELELNGYANNSENSMMYQYERESLQQFIGQSLQEACGQYGPIHQNYKIVLSMELMELDEDEDENENNTAANNSNNIVDNETESPIERHKKIHESAIAAFQPIYSSSKNNETSIFKTVRTTTTTANAVRKNKRPKKKRIRVFFYNTYAEHIFKFMNEYDNATTSMEKNDKNITKSIYPYLVALQNIPAKCIFPYHMGRSERASESLLDNDYGRLSPYCICIGGEGRSHSKNNCQLSFHSDQSEVRFFPLLHLTQEKKGSNDNNDNDMVMKRDEFMLCDKNHRFDVVPLTISQDCAMADRYIALMKFCNEKKQLDQNKPKTTHGKMKSSSSVINTSVFPTPPRGKKRKHELSTNHTYTMLSEIEGIFKKTKGQRDKEREINIHGIVLCSSIPKLTRKGDWMIQMTITDDSIFVRGGKEEDRVISTVSFTAFKPDKDSLPKLFCAGDILRGHRLLIDEWNGSTVLTSLKWSTFCVLHSKIEYNFDPITATSITKTKKDWEVSGCLTKSPLDLCRVDQLWRYGQKLLSNHPTINPKFRIYVENISPYNDDKSDGKYGDMIAMIALIIPFPQSIQTRHSPKGFMRVWDGTGPPVTDPLPFGVNRVPQNEPSSKTLLSIANIIKKTNSRSKNVNRNRIETNHINPPKSLCGRVVSVVIWEASHWDLILNSKDYFSVGKFVRFRNIKEGNLFCSEPGKNGPKCLHAEASTLLTPLPDYAYDITQLLETHNKRIAQGFPFNPRSGLLPLNKKLPKELESNQYVITSLPQCLRRQNHDEKKSRYDLIECMIDESLNKTYPVQFQIMNSLCIPRKEQGLERHIVFDIRDFSAQFAVVVPFKQVSGYADKWMKASNDKNNNNHNDDDFKIDQVVNAMKSQVFESIIRCCQIDGTKYFVLVDELKECSDPQLLHRSHTV